MAEGTWSEPAPRDDAEPRRTGGRLLVGPYRVLRGNRPLALLSLGYACSSLGTWLTFISLSILTYALSHTATTVALMSFALLAPPALCAPLVGMLVNHVDLKRVLLAANGGCALCLLGLTVVRSPATLWIAFPLASAASIGASVRSPAMSALVPRLVVEEARADANNLKNQIESITNVVAPVLSSLLFLTGRAAVGFVVAGLAYGVAAGVGGVVAVGPRQEAVRTAPEGRLGAMLAGFRFLFRENERVLSRLVLAETGLNVATGAWYALIVLLCATSFGLGATSAGFLDAAWAAGGVVGGFVVAWAPPLRRFGGLFIVGAAGTAVGTVLFGLSPSGLWPFVIVIVSGIADAALLIDRGVILQAATPHDMVGRVFSAFEAARVVAMVVGTLIVGGLIDAVGPRGAAVTLGAAGLAGLLLALPSLFQLERALGVRIFLRQVPVMAPLSRRLLDDLGGRLRRESYTAGAVIVRQGERGDRLYMVKDGTVEVSVQDADAPPILVNVLHKLDYFGEIALIEEIARTATVRARGPVQVYSLERADYQALIGREVAVDDAIRATAAARHAATPRATAERAASGIGSEPTDAHRS